MSDAVKILNEMLVDIKNHQRDKKSLLPMYISSRLDLSLKTYYSELMNNFTALSGYNEKNVLKQLTKENKN